MFGASVLCASGVAEAAAVALALGVAVSAGISTSSLSLMLASASVLVSSLTCSLARAVLEFAGIYSQPFESY